MGKEARTVTNSKRKRAGSRKNKRNREVGTQPSDRRKS